MRSLKFRAWNNEEYIYAPNRFVYTDDYDKDDVDDYEDIGHFFCTRDNIEQYTGLKDKNGKEIYEGDIVHRGALSKVNVFRNSVINFDEDSVSFIATSTRNGYHTLFNSYICDEIEVIGNIHENPELLEN